MKDQGERERAGRALAGTPGTAGTAGCALRGVGGGPRDEFPEQQERTNHFPRKSFITA